jgi:SAM-dependent methyltransferase
VSTGHDYVFDTGRADERARLDAHAGLWDPFTFGVLDGVGIADGWRCLEIGAGTGSVAQWLLERVGRRGQVVATDIETRWLEPMASTNLVVRHHDIRDEPIDDGGFDLIHARLVLEHLPQRAAVAAKLVAALRPGGWLVAEDYDVRTIGFATPPHPAWSAVAAQVPAAMDAVGADLVLGSGLRDLLVGAGLVDLDVHGYLRQAPIAELAPIFRPPLEGLRDALVASGRVTAEEVDAALAAFEPPPAGMRQTATYTPVLVAARGRRPSNPVDLDR